jgi:hypothetical protein
MRKVAQQLNIAEEGGREPFRLSAEKISKMYVFQFSGYFYHSIGRHFTKATCGSFSVGQLHSAGKSWSKSSRAACAVFDHSYTLNISELS